MDHLELFNARTNKRETPVGREYEVKIIYWDCFALILGCIALVVHLPPLLFVAAIAHLTMGLLISVSKLVWAISAPLLTALFTALLAGALYLVQVFYFGFPVASVTAHIQSAWPEVIAAAIVTAGIIGQLFSGAGNADRLQTFLNRYGSDGL